MVLVVKNPPANAGDRKVACLIPGLEKSPGGGPANPLQYSLMLVVFLPRESHVQRSLVGYGVATPVGPWGCKESNAAKLLQLCPSWTIKKAESRRIDAFKLWC